MTKEIPSRVQSKPVDIDDLIGTAGSEARADFDSKTAVLQAARLVFEARQAASLSQQELAERAETTQSAISDIERGAGSQGPTVATLARLLNACRSKLQLEATLPLQSTDLEPRLNELQRAVERAVNMRPHRRRRGTRSASIPTENIDMVQPLGMVNVDTGKSMWVERVSGPHVDALRFTLVDQAPSPHPRPKAPQAAE